MSTGNQATLALLDCLVGRFNGGEDKAISEQDRQQPDFDALRAHSMRPSRFIQGSFNILRTPSTDQEQIHDDESLQLSAPARSVVYSEINQLLARICIRLTVSGSPTPISTPLPKLPNTPARRRDA